MLNSKQKKFNWNIELDTKLLDLKRMYRTWTICDIAYYFLKNSPKLVLDMLQITCNI